MSEQISEDVVRALERVGQMSARNIEVLRRWIVAYNARDIEAMIAYFHPGLELHSAFAAVGGGVYHGHAGLRSWHDDMRDAWGEEIRFEAECHFDLGDETLTFYVVHGRGSHSGVEVAMPGALLTRWRDGLIAYWRSYPHREDALSDLGVCGDQLEPIEP